jgi:hypothetical protein
MTTFFGIIGMLGSAVCAAWLIIQWIRKQPKKLPLICLAASLVLMVLCASIETENDKTREKHAAAVYEAISSAEKAAMPEETQTPPEETQTPPEETQTPEPTATPNNIPDVSLAPVEVAKVSIEDVKQILYDKIAGNFEYVDVKGDETSISVNVAESGIALEAILANSQEKFTEWREMKKGMQSFSEAVYKLVKDSGFGDTIVYVNLLNDQNKENTLIMYMNGVLIYDAIDN